MSRDTSFFEEVRQFEGEARGHKFLMPLFYYEASALFLVYTASYRAVKSLLPSTRLRPYRVLAGRALLGLGAFAYRDTDIGPYNEFAVAVPVSLDKTVNLGLPSTLRALAGPAVFVTHLPVTTEVAFVAGKEVYNFPKFVADIDIEESGSEISVNLAQGEQKILGITAPAKKGERPPIRLCINSYTFKNGRIVRCEIMGEGKDMAISLGDKGVSLSLGQDHFMARDIKRLELKRPMAAVYVPRARAILTNPLESLPAVKD